MNDPLLITILFLIGLTCAGLLVFAWLCTQTLREIAHQFRQQFEGKHLRKNPTRKVKSYAGPTTQQ